MTTRMYRLIVAELIKTTRSKGVLVGGAFFIVILAILQYQTTQYVGQIGQDAQQVRTTLQHPRGMCPPAQVCSRSLSLRERKSLQTQLRVDEKLIGIGRVALSTKGVNVVLAGLLASAPGAALGLLLGAFLMGLEFRSGALANVLTRAPRRQHLVLAKWIAGMTLFAGLWAAGSAVLTLETLTVHYSTRHVAAPNVSWGNFMPGFITFAMPVTVFSCFLIIGLFGCLLLQSPFGGLSLMTGLVLVDAIAAGMFSWIRPATLNFNVFGAGSTFRGALSRVATSFIWPTDYPAGPVAWIGFTYLLGVSALLLALAIVVIRAQEVM
jgi:hypothetical protein